MEQSEELKELKDALEILEYHYSEYAGVLRKNKDTRVFILHLATDQNVCYNFYYSNMLKILNHEIIFFTPGIILKEEKRTTYWNSTQNIIQLIEKFSNMDDNLPLYQK